MANLRRTKLKAIRAGCQTSEIIKCKDCKAVEKLVSKLNKDTGANHNVSSE